MAIPSVISFVACSDLIRGDNLDIDILNMNIKLFPMNSTQDDVINYIVNLENHTIVGIGNMVGWGETFLKQLEKMSENSPGRQQNPFSHGRPFFDSFFHPSHHHIATTI